MAGTTEGGKKVAVTIKERYGDDYYAKIGSKGGAQNRPETRMFYKNRNLAIEAGRKGGKTSRRRKGVNA